MAIISNRLFTEEQIAKLEKAYNAKYILDTSIRAKGGGWANMPVAVFYTEEAHPKGSNYLGIFIKEGKLYVTDAISATEAFPALLLENGDLMVSRYRHDYFTHGGYMVDGGREYIRSSGNGTHVLAYISGDKVAFEYA